MKNEINIIVDIVLMACGFGMILGTFDPPKNLVKMGSRYVVRYGALLGGVFVGLIVHAMAHMQ